MNLIFVKHIPFNHSTVYFSYLVWHDEVDRFMCGFEFMYKNPIHLNMLIALMNAFEI